MLSVVARSRAAAVAATRQLRRGVHSSAPACRIYDNILHTIGNTPVVRLNTLSPREDVTIYAKCEFFNPLSSVKDRLAIAIIEDAEASGELQPGQTVVEATSGNTGIALAMVCAAKGYPLVVTMAESFSVERRRVMRALGAKVVLTPAAERGTGMVKKAKELAAANGWFQALQFDNPSNPRYHASTTGAEILSDFAGKRLDYYVTGYGTGGTVAGVGKVLKAARPETKIVLTEPAGAPLVSSGEPQTDGVTHPAWSPHPIQGWTPDFISSIAQNALNVEDPADEVVDEIRTISHESSIATSLALASKEGIFTGISGGATVATAIEVAQNAPEGAVVLAMCPDTAERYLSTPLFENIGAAMDEEEVAISESTPNFQLPPPAGN